jgi:phage-related minor tail protein
MASGKIKGITIEFDGNTTKLGKALKDVDKKTRDLDKELKQVNNALKFNPTNVELWRQKQQLLSEKVGETKKRLDALKLAQKEMDASGVDKSSAEYRELQREIITTESKLKTFESQLKQVGNANLKALEQQFREVGGKIESVGQSLKGVSIASAGVVAGLGAISYKAGVAADDLNTLSKVTGIGTGDLQKYSYAADLVDVSVDTIAKSNKKLAKNAYSAANGSKAQAEAFAKIGVSVTDANGNLRDSESIFQDVITGLGQMTNETERDALAQQLMGKSAAELNPLIEDGGKTYKMVSDTMKKYNLDYVDQETLDKANEFNDSIDTMKLLGSVAFAQVGSQLAGYLAPALEKVVDLVGKFANWLSKLSPETLTVIATIAGVLAVLAPLLITIGKVATGIGAIIKVVNLLSGSVGLLSSGTLLPIIAVIAAVVAAGILLYKNWDKIKKAASLLGTKIKNVWTSIKTATKTAWTTIRDAVTKPFTTAYDKVKKIIDKIKGWFPIKLGNLFKGIKLPHFDVEWSTITAFGKSIDFPSGFDIDWYKKGGIFNSPSLIGVGEAGSEAVVPLDKFWDKLDAMQMGGPTINIYPGPNQSAREIAKEVEKILVQQQKQRNRAYGGI